MKRKVLCAVFVFISLFFCLSLGISSFFFDRNTSLEQSDEIQVPKLTDADFGSSINDILTQKMPFRSTAIQIKTLLMEKIFHTSATDRVIIGSNGWLYFDESVPEYVGSALLSDEQIAQIIEKIQSMYDDCKSKNVQFVFTVAPNKNTLYPENMPARYIKARSNNYDRLTAALMQTDIPFVDFHDLNTLSDEPLYYKMDTHWNTEGGIIAYNRILDALDITHASFHDTPRTTGQHQGDLEQMLHPNAVTNETESVLDYEFAYEYTGRFKSFDDITIRTTNANGSGSLVMYRDSFGNALIPLFAEHFNTACFSRSVPPDLSLIDSQNADVVVYEIVQRNIENIIKY